MTAFSKECLEKIEKARIEKDYHTVHSTPLSLLHCCVTYHLVLCDGLLASEILPRLLTVLSQVVKLCQECLEKQQNVLADTHLYKLRVLSVAGEVLSYMHCFSDAADYAHRMVEGYV